MPVVDPNPDRLPAKRGGNHQVQVLIAIHIAGADVQTAGRPGFQIETATLLSGKENFDAVAVSAIDQTLGPGKGQVGTVVAIEIA